MIWASLLGILFTVAFAGVWLGVALAFAGFIMFEFPGGGVGHLVAPSVWGGLNMYTLAAVTCFLLMGQIIIRSGVSARLYGNLSLVVGRLRGGLLHTNIMLCALFSAIFGSSAATAAAVGSIAIPELRHRGYDDRLLLGSITAGGALGIMIPPSGSLIIYGSYAEVSIRALFAGGIIPGIGLALLFMIYIGVRCLVTPKLARSEVKLPWKQMLLGALGVWPLVILIAVVLVPILCGWCTATESAGIGVFGALIMGLLFGKLGFKELREAVSETAKICGMLYLLVGGAMILANAVGMLGLPRHLVLTVGSLDMPNWAIMIGIMILYLGLGCIFDGISFMVTTLPFVIPLVMELGYDLVWFGIFLNLLIQIGQLTPPVGVNLYVVQAIAGKGTSIRQIVLSCLPYILIMILAMLLLLVHHPIATWLPTLIGAME